MSGKKRSRLDQEKRGADLKRRIFFLIIFFVTILIPLNSSAAMLRIMISYKKGYEKIDHKPVDIKDWYWKFPVLEVPKPFERERYSMVIEGYNANRKVTETLELVGAGVSRNSILLPTEGTLVIDNKEEFPRKINILMEGENQQKVELTVPAKGSLTHVFSSPGDYTLVDTLFQWNTVYVRILRSSYLFPVEEGANRIEIPDITPGTYTVRVYYGIRWVYQEDFVMISHAAQNIGYKIEDGTIYSINSSAYSTTISSPED
jgi:hypothetical protein